MIEEAFGALQTLISHLDEYIDNHYNETDTRPKSSAFSRLSTQEVVRTDSEAVG